MKASNLKVLNLPQLKEHYCCLQWLLEKASHLVGEHYHHRQRLAKQLASAKKELLARAETMGYKIINPSLPKMRTGTVDQLIVNHAVEECLTDNDSLSLLRGLKVVDRSVILWDIMLRQDKEGCG